MIHTWFEWMWCCYCDEPLVAVWLADMIVATWTNFEPQALTRSMRVDGINSCVDLHVVRLRGLIQSRRGGRNLGNQIPSRLSQELWLLLDSQSLTGTPDGVPMDLLLPCGRFKWDYGRLLVQYRRLHQRGRKVHLRVHKIFHLAQIIIRLNSNKQLGGQKHPELIKWLGSLEIFNNQPIICG